MTNQSINPQDLLEQILSAGQDLLKQSSAKSSELTSKGKIIAEKGEDYLADKLGIDETDASREALRKGVGAGAAAGALALLLSSRSGRKLATLGGLAGIGAIAYRAHQTGKMPQNVQDVIGLIKGPSADTRSQALISAMISAAKADGEISQKERALIEAKYPKSGDFLSQMFETAPDPADIAAMARSTQEAAEIYAVSCRVANGLNPSERNYLDELAMALNLEPDVAAKIETDVRTGL